MGKKIATQMSSY